MKTFVREDAAGDVYLIADERGSSETYEDVCLACYTPTGTLAWLEGLRKDRTHMEASWRVDVEKALNSRHLGIGNIKICF